MGTRRNRLSEAVLTSTHNLCFRAKIRKNVYPDKLQFYYTKVGCKGYSLHGLVFVMDDGMRYGHTISSPFEPDDSGKLKQKKAKHNK